MKRILFAIAATALSVSAFAANVGVSVSIGQPGFYGRIDLGNMPPPQLIYSQPVVIQSAPYAVVRQPIYLHVPPGHAREWGRYCGRYNACAQPVFFVEDRWYNDVYVPHYRDHDGWRNDRRYSQHNERRRDWDDRHDRGRGRDHDRGHDKHDRH